MIDQSNHGNIMGQDDHMDLKINGRLTSESSYFLNMSQNLGIWRWSYSYRLNQDFSWEKRWIPRRRNRGVPRNLRASAWPSRQYLWNRDWYDTTWCHGLQELYIYTYTCIYQIQVLCIYIYSYIYIYIYIVSICLALNITWAVDILDVPIWLENWWTVNGESPGIPPDKPWYLVMTVTLCYWKWS